VRGGGRRRGKVALSWPHDLDQRPGSPFPYRFAGKQLGCGEAEAQLGQAWLGGEEKKEGKALFRKEFSSREKKKKKSKRKGDKIYKNIF